VLSPAVCGAEPAGERLGLYFPSPGMHWDEETDGPYPESPPVPDPFAEWNAPDICRPCLLTWLLEPEPAVAPEPQPEQPSTWWTRVKRAWQG
jgi:hypothetical protein